jgi:hypothetical protein
MANGKPCSRIQKRQLSVEVNEAVAKSSIGKGRTGQAPSVRLQSVSPSKISFMPVFQPASVTSSLILVG